MTEWLRGQENNIQVHEIFNIKKAKIPKDKNDKCSILIISNAGAVAELEAPNVAIADLIINTILMAMADPKSSVKILDLDKLLTKEK